MEQFDQLLTCCVCLDRYRNPKLLPCQHSFCMEPCMEGLVDYVRRQVKCPECRAEHRIPYQGVQAFPTNVTLQRFLELHIDLTGELPDPTSNQIMERCQICSEKAYLNSCAHCEKKVCPDCKEAHVEVVKREITRLSSQVRRTLTRLEDALSVTEKSLNGLKGNQNHVLDEVDDIVRRFTKAINDKADTIRHELEHYVSTELTTLNSYKTNLETELANIQSNCELVDKHMVAEGTGGMSWDDQELMDTKDIFLKTLEFIRNFDYEPGDRRIRFTTHQETNQLAVTLANFGELILPTSIFAALLNSKPAPVQPPPVQPSPGIMRSKSDHRLVQQYRDMDDMDEKASSFRSKYSKYGGGGGGGDGESRFRRLTRKLVDDDDDDGGRLGGFNDGEDRPKAVPTRARVIETDDAVKGPLSGVSRLLDSTRVLEKMVEFENPRRKTTPTTGPAAVPLAILQMQQHMQKLLQQKQQQQSQTPTTPTSPSAPWRQNSLDKSSASKASSVAPLSRQQSKVDKPRSESESSSSDHHSGSGSSSGSSSRKVSTGASFTTEEIKRRFSNTAVPQTSSNSSTAVKSSTPASSTVSKYRRNLTPVASASKLNKDEDDSETTSDESEETESDEPVTTPAKSLSRMEKTDIGPLLARSAIARDREPASTSSSSVASHRRDSSLRDYDSYRPRDHEPTTSVRQRDHHESIRPRDIEPISTSASRSRFADTSSSDQSRRTRDPPPLERRVSRDEGSTPGSMYTAYRNRQPKSPPERHYGSSSGTSGSGAGSSAASRYGTSSSTTSSPYDYGLSRSRTGTSLYDPPESSTSRLQAKYLNRSRHNLGGSIDVPDDHVRPSGNPYYSGRSSYLAKPGVGAGAERRDSNAGLSSREKSKLLLSKSKSHHELAQPDHEIRDDENLSSWARYLKNKYGKTVTPYTPTSSSSSAYQSQPQSPTSPLSDRDRDPFHDIMGTSSSTKINRSTRGKSATPQSHTITTAQYSGKKRLIFKFGSRGSDPGQFTWPRGIACGADGLIAVADSSNHRIQVFDPRGRFLKEFGSYGNSDSEFDCLAGVTINKIGQFVVSDRYNHRIQVFDPSCKFLRSFGSQGSGDGKFNHPWGITTDSLGFIYVCDKDNHRIQVFQSDGSFVGKFGASELNSPHYIAVTNTNKVVVSDTGHHRVCIFDVNGKILATFGTEGIEHGQFKLPRGVAVDDQGYIFVADSGNNRIQIFNPDGVHIKSFGSWGSGDREFKGLEGITVNSEGNVFVCDRENHRIQVF